MGFFPLFLSLSWHWYQWNPAPFPGESPGTDREGLCVLGLIFSELSLTEAGWHSQVRHLSKPPCPAPGRGGREGRRTQGMRGHSSRAVLLTSAVPFNDRKNSAVKVSCTTLRCYRNLHFYPSLCNALGFFFSVFMFVWDFLPWWAVKSQSQK